MKIACTADWHIHQFTEFSKLVPVRWDDKSLRFVSHKNGKVMNSRLLNILDGICDIRDYCVQNNITYVLNAGDTFHKRGSINVETFNYTYRILESFKLRGINLIMIAGNHDQVDSSESPHSSLYTFQKICTVIESPTYLRYPDFSVLAIPYSFNIKQIIENSEKATILLTHCGISGSLLGSGITATDELSVSDLSPNRFSYISLGHYHCPQIIAPNVFYCGTPVQESFSDERDTYNGFYVVDTEKFSIDFIPVIKPRFITLINEIPKDSFNFFRVKVTTAETAKPTGENVRWEVEKEYTNEKRSEIMLSDDIVTAVKKYAKDTDTDTLVVGLQILKTVGENYAEI